MYQAFLIKYGEIGVKGKNRHIFEDTLVSRIRSALMSVEGDFTVRKESGRIYVEANQPESHTQKGIPDSNPADAKIRYAAGYDYEEVIDALQHVFGIVGICPVVLVEDEGFENLAGVVADYVAEAFPQVKDGFTFKVVTRRARKNYPMESMKVSAALGERLLDAYPSLKVDVHEPDVVIHVEIRNKINIYSKVIPGPGGMPVGTAGRAMLLLSGGIDSPVAGYMVAKRGVKIDAVYFHAPPYTGERAKEKVIDLARIVSQYAGPIQLHIVNFTDIQLSIYDKCPHDQLTIIMRRYMMRLAERFAGEDGDLGLVTGESIGQVASQTMQSLLVTDEVCTLPVYRPLIGFDKQEIIDYAKKIGTYETSILPFEDCCTIFVAKHPVTKPNLKSIKKSEGHLTENMEALLEEAVSSAETIRVGAG